MLYHYLGNDAQAEPLYRQSIQILKDALGENHPFVANALNSLAALYEDMGDYSQAESLYKQALQIRKEALGDKHPAYATSLHSLASLYREMGHYREAESSYKQAIQIYKEVLGEQHPYYANSLNNLGLLYDEQGDYAQAEPLLKQALAIRKQLLGEMHPDYAISLNNLGRLYHHQGDFARAETLYKQALEIRRQVLGDQHPDCAVNLNCLARLYYDRGDLVQAEPLAHQALQISRHNLDLTAAIQSERQQLRMAESLRKNLDAYLSIAESAAVPAERVYAEVLAWKGSVSARQLAMRQLRVAPQNRKVADLYDQLTVTSCQLDSLSRTTPKPSQIEQYRSQLSALNETLEALQRQLASESVEYRRTLSQRDTTPADLRRVLPADTVLVDLLEYWHYLPAKTKGEKSSLEQRLTAFVIGPQQPIMQVELGPVAPIAAAVDRWRKDYAVADAAELRRLIWQPLEERISGAKTVLVSPDGELDRFPLAALPGKKEGTYLIEDAAIGTVAIPRLLPELLASAPSVPASEPSLLTVGDVDFDFGLSSITLSEQPATAAPLNRGGTWHFAKLDGTRVEIAAIDNLFRQRFPDGEHSSLRQGHATKAAVCEAMPRYVYLHFATHGFFAPPELQSALSEMGTNGGAANAISGGRADAVNVTGYHPDLLVGLALAGANHRAELGQDDGILTALEVASLDLHGVDLAILSACETGLGQTAGGEGVLGLQRAFQLAGARRCVSSLWSVDDAATQTLMTEFYKRLWDKDHPEGKLQALRDAQLEMLRRYDPHAEKLVDRGRGIQLDTPVTDGNGCLSPRYWAAFELSGDWR